MNNKYLVTNLEGREKDIVKLKASLSNKTLDELVLEALNAFPIEMQVSTCPRCGENNKAKQQTIDYVIEVAGQQHSIIIENFPKMKCHVCDNEYDNLVTETLIEKLIRVEVLKSLKGRKGVLKNIDFNELIRF
ncbi:hypothetical protein ABC382_00515 [Lysinibacillus sp. 1P01SD]|uniref:hypothetical protein n=1 Tax=Lysinibacillus sp. 1P01SD TaxID=3132285 RepID=UPI00399FCD42